LAVVIGFGFEMLMSFDVNQNVEIIVKREKNDCFDVDVKLNHIIDFSMILSLMRYFMVFMIKGWQRMLIINEDVFAIIDNWNCYFY